MPPASSPAAPVMMPGPRNASIAATWRHWRARMAAQLATGIHARKAGLPVIGENHVHGVVDRDNASQAAHIVDDRQRQHVVLGDQPRDLLLRIVQATANQLTVHGA